MPQTIGRYEIKRELGRGGMATVYLGIDPDLQREVAIKVLPRQFTHDPRFLERFKQEARTIAALEHYAIVPIHGFGEEDDAPYLVMRYMSGGSLRERMGGKSLSLPETSRILERLAPALDKAHSRGVIHRDLKPDNVLFDEDGQPYLADFGIARMAEATHTMTMIGTPGYMSPEQVEGQQKLDWRSDIYGLGVMLFEMFSGRQPYKAETPAAQMLMHIRQPVPDLLAANPDLPPQTQAVIEKGMAKDREARYQTAAAVAEAVRHLRVVDAAMEPAAPVVMPAVVEIQDEAADVTVLDTPPEGMVAAVKAEPVIADNNPDSVSSSVDEQEPRKRGRLPAWAWWAGAAAVVLLLVFGIREILGGGGGEEVPQPADENSEAVLAVLPTAVATLDPNLPPPSPTLGSVWERPQDKMQMVFVPQGTFLMGSEDGVSDEQPLHDVALDGFWIDETEVTNVHYNSCVEAGECVASRYINDSIYNGSDYPVVGVSWNDADTYCRWVGGRLPAEAQWEYAARGPDGKTYPWGEKETTCGLAQYRSCDGNTVPVGSYLEGASWVGALDMAGNAWEWGNDWYDSDYYASSAVDNPEGPENGSKKVLRGGGWRNLPFILHGANRSAYIPDFVSYSIGFRCVLPGG